MANTVRVAAAFVLAVFVFWLDSAHRPVSRIKCLESDYFGVRENTIGSIGLMEEHT